MDVVIAAGYDEGVSMTAGDSQLNARSLCLRVMLGVRTKKVVSLVDTQESTFGGLEKWIYFLG